MNSILKIVLLSHQVARNDGQGRVNYEVAMAALERGHEVTLITSRCAPELLQFPGAQLIHIDCEQWPTQLVRNLYFATASARWLTRYGSGFDIVQVNGFVTWSPSDINVAHFVHSAWYRSPYYPFRFWCKRPSFAYQRIFTALNARWEGSAFARSRSVVAVSETVAGELRHIHISPGKICVIHNGVDPSEFFPGTSNRPQFSLPMDVPLFLFAGDIRTSRKNLDTVLRAIRKTPSIHLAIAGNLKGSIYPSLAAEFGVSDRTHFLGTVLEMPLLMRSVDGFVLPSHYDPLGLVILEAMASGLPVITSRAAGGSEILGDAGWILEKPDDVDTLSSWLATLAKDKILCSKLGQEARAAACLNTWERMASRYLDLYEEVHLQKKKTIQEADGWQ